MCIHNAKEWENNRTKKIGLIAPTHAVILPVNNKYRVLFIFVDKKWF